MKFMPSKIALRFMLTVPTVRLFSRINCSSFVTTKPGETLAREIWLAPILSDNRDRLLEGSSDVLATGPAEALLYLVPSRPLLELAAGRLLDGARVRGV